MWGIVDKLAPVLWPILWAIIAVGGIMLAHGIGVFVWLPWDAMMPLVTVVLLFVYGISGLMRSLDRRGTIR